MTQVRGTRLRRVTRAREAAQRLETPAGLRKGLGSPALFAIVQCFIAASLYFGLGLIAQRAQGWTWLVMLAAAAFFVLLIFSYVEGASLHQERGGATVLARYAFNELWSFVAGWAILLDYVLLVALTAFAATSYAGVLWDPLDDGLVEVALVAVLVAAMAWVNVRGGGRRRFDFAALWVLVDLILTVLIILAGLLLVLDPTALSDPASLGTEPSGSDLLFAFTLALVAFAGIDVSSSLAGEVPIGRRGLKRLIAARVIATFVPYVGLGLLAVSTLPLATMDPNAVETERPMVEIVAGFDEAWLRGLLEVLIPISAMAILAIACNAAMLGLSRLGYSLALNRQIPSGVGRLHRRHHTPYVVIVMGAVLAFALVLPDDLEFLAGLYAFGATLAFTLVHLSVIRLRFREPQRDRPYRMPLSIRTRGVDLPIPAMVGALMSGAAFVSVVVLHAGARAVGLGWMAIGLSLYVLYRVTQGKPVFRRVSVPEQTLTRNAAPEAQYGSILVPVLGSPLDDDIMQTAGRLAAEQGEDEGEGGAVIEALWVFEIPMSLPIDAPVPEGELKRARAALQRAKRVGEEYAGVEVATATTRARRAGEGIVYEAERRGVEAIVLAAEPPTGVRGGVLLGGREGLRDTVVGDMTRYVVTKAPCRVVLTAPPEQRAPTDPTWSTRRVEKAEAVRR
jgi:APA family basic amino acid/polyamine antiporter